MVESGLYVVSTPIGNLRDLTARAVDILGEVDIVYAEDTRRTGILLRKLGIHSELRSLHEHNESRRSAEVTSRIAAGGSCALVSDAGTPVISDPGLRVVTAVTEAGQRVFAVPGPSAILAALTVAGIDASRFTFVGFSPRTGSARDEWLRTVVESSATVVAFESPRRLGATLATLAELGAGERTAAVCREMTKKFEETRRGTVAQLAEYYRDAEPRGEVTLVLAGRADAGVDPATARRRASELMAAGHTRRDVVRALRDELGLSRNQAYSLALASDPGARDRTESVEGDDANGGDGGVQDGG